MIAQNKIEWVARAGYSARGIVYLLTAGMALLSVFGGGTPDSKSALQMVLGHPLGQVWLALIGFGLIAFIVWRLVQAVLDTDHHGKEPKGLAVRASLLVSAATYTGLASYATGQALHLSLGAGSSNSRESWTSWLIQQPFGRYLVGLLGFIIIGAGVVQVIKGARRGYKKYFRRDWPSSPMLNGICIYGLAARGILFVIIGGFFVFAAFAVDPQQAGSTSDAMQWVRRLPFGFWLYLFAAAGLFAFGLYGLIEARYRRVDAPDAVAPRRILPI